MPTDQMVRFWKGKEETGQNTSTEFVETLKTNIEMIREMAYTNETNQKESQKYYHDRKSVVRELEEGDLVVVFRPIKRSKLEKQWQRPYPISKRMAEVTYQINLGTTGKRFRTFHVNCMRKWTSPVPAAFMTLDEEGIN